MGQAETRYLELVDQLATEMGRPYGWLTAVAKRLGIHRSSLKRIIDGERSPSADTVDAAVRGVPVERSFFTVDEGHYRDFAPAPSTALAPWADPGPTDCSTTAEILTVARETMEAYSRPGVTWAERAELARSLAAAVERWDLVALAAGISATSDPKNAARAGGRLAFALLREVRDQSEA